MKKALYVFCIIAGALITIYGFISWGKASYPFSFWHLIMSLFVSRPYKIEQDAYFFVMFFGLCISAYGVLELYLKRWEVNDNESKNI